MIFLLRQTIVVAYVNQIPELDSMILGFHNFYRPCSRRALSLCFAALLCVGFINHAHPQAMRRVSGALMPSTGGIGLVRTFQTLHAEPSGLSNTQHPLFDTSYAGSEQEILASTKYGNVTSSDLYLWMVMTRSENKAYLPQLLKKSRFQKERTELAEALRPEIDSFVFHNYILPRLLPAAPGDAVYDFKHYLYTLPAWQTVFLQRVVQSGIQITDADRQKYLQENTVKLVEPQRLRTRYIFLRSPETDDPITQGRTEVRMDELRAQILRGEISFEDAARQHSQAPSASRGGEIPPFQHGELFYLFEHAAAELEPGEISRAFRGPNGLYVVQLIEVIEPEKPSLSNPRHAEAVDEGLSRQVLRAAYEIYMRDMLLERRRLVEKPQAWDSLEEDEIVGSVCEFTICKSQMRSAFPHLEGSDLKFRYEEMATLLRSILELEAMAQEVREHGCHGDPILERARWMAGNLIRRDAWVDQLRAALPISEQLVYKFWQDNPKLFTPMALKRVIRLTMRPSNTAPLPTQTRMELDKVLAQATGQPMVLPLQQRIREDEEAHGIVPDVPARTAEAFEMLTNPSEEPNYYSDDYSQESLQAIIDAGSDGSSAVPEDGALPPGLEPLSAPSSVTTDTLDSLVPREPEPTPNANVDPIDPAEDSATTGTVLEISTINGERGGAAPTPAAGGVSSPGIALDGEVGAPVADADLNMIAPGTRPTPAPVSIEERATREAADREESLESAGTPIRGATRPAQPAATPTGGAVPIGITRQELVPGARLQATPNPDNQLKPPPTSSTPYNPDWFYARLTPTEIGNVVGHYSSSDWLLVMDDLGFVYTPDIADAPAKLEEVPIGAFSRPIVRDQNAISWYIEDARQLPTPPFEEVRTHAYETYRSVQLDKAMADRYNSELDKADIKYRF